MAKNEDKWGKAEDILRQRGYISGLGTKDNLKDWASYAKQNSFDQRASKAQSRDALEGVEGLHEAEVDRISNDKDWKQDLRDDSRATYWSRKLGTGSNKG